MSRIKANLWTRHNVLFRSCKRAQFGTSFQRSATVHYLFKTKEWTFWSCDLINLKLLTIISPKQGFQLLTKSAFTLIGDMQLLLMEHTTLITMDTLLEEREHFRSLRCKQKKCTNIVKVKLVLNEFLKYFASSRCSNERYKRGSPEVCTLVTSICILIAIFPPLGFHTSIRVYYTQLFHTYLVFQPADQNQTVFY